MNRLVFNYGAMNSGKSLLLLAFAAKLRNKNIPYIVLKPSMDTRDGAFIKSRPLNEKLPCKLWNEHEYIDELLPGINYILVDEAQFLTAGQVEHLSYIVNNIQNISVICYGLRTDFRTHLFEGSKRLFELADELHEIEDVDATGDKVIINARIKDSQIITEGSQVEIGAEDKYQPMSRREFFSRLNVAPHEEI